MLTTTLEQFLSDNAIVGFWYTSVGTPSGTEYQINDEEDTCGEDYLDAQDLLEMAPLADFIARQVEGEVTVDSDGDKRWSPVAWDDDRITDNQGNTVTKIVVWAETLRESTVES